MDRELEAQKKFSENLTQNNTQFRILSLTKAADQQKLLAQQTLSELLRSQTPIFGISLLYNGESKKALFFYGEEVKNDEAFLDNASFMHELGQLIATDNSYVYNQWFLFQRQDQWLLLLVNHYSSMYFCSIVDLNCYFSMYPINETVDDSQGVVYSEKQSLLAPPGIDGDQLVSSIGGKEGTFNTLRYKVSCLRLDSCPLGIALVIPRWRIVADQFPTITFFLVVVAVLCVFLWKVFHQLDKSLTFPLREIAAQMAQLSGQEAQPTGGEWGDFEEYNAIHTALDELLQKKNEIEAQNYANKQQKEHAMLQYFQLQTRSHFFINCLKSLYGMTENYNIARMQAMILSFSNHLRYIFHDTLNLVTLREEMQEVQDYHRIITLDMPRPFLLKQDVPAELLEVKLPPLAIQTFLENTYKYAKQEEGVLVFHIEASMVEHNEKPYLRLHLSDNGQGYPDQVLESINQKETCLFTTNHVGINNLRRRMDLLFGEKYEMAFYNEGLGNAHSVIYIPISP